MFALHFLAANELAAAGSDGNIHEWDIARQQEIRTWQAHTGTVAAIAAYDGQLLSAGFDASVRMWNVQDRVVRRNNVRQY